MTLGEHFQRALDAKALLVRRLELLGKQAQDEGKDDIAAEALNACIEAQKLLQALEERLAG